MFLHHAPRLSYWLKCCMCHPQHAGMQNAKFLTLTYYDVYALLALSVIGTYKSTHKLVVTGSFIYLARIL